MPRRAKTKSVEDFYFLPSNVAEDGWVGPGYFYNGAGQRSHFIVLGYLDAGVYRIDTLMGGALMDGSFPPYPQTWENEFRALRGERTKGPLSREVLTRIAGSRWKEFATVLRQIALAPRTHTVVIGSTLPVWGADS